MSYEWFANTFPMRAFWGFNEGSTYERVNGYASTVSGAPSMKPGVGASLANGALLQYGNVLDITDTTAPFTIVQDITYWRSQSLVGNNTELLKGTAGPGYWYVGTRSFSSSCARLVMTAGGGTLDVSAAASVISTGRFTKIISYDGGLLAAGVTFWINGALAATFALSNTLVAGSCANANQLQIAGTPSQHVGTVAIINRAVTGSEAARIYKHLRTERPARIHPRRKFSIPMPLRTQPVELADGYIWAAAGGMANGKWPDLIQGARPATRVGPIDVAAHGVFDQCLVNNYVAGGTVPAASLTLPAGDTDVFNSNDWTFSCWLQVPVASAAVRKILQLDGTNYYIALDAAEKIQVSSVNGAAAQVTTTSTAALITGKWYHVLVSRQMVGADMRTRILLDGTVDTDSTAAGIGVTLPGAGNPRLADGGMRIDAVRYRKDVVTSDADARTECLQGGKQVLFDGRLCRRGCCPVMPVAATLVGTGSPWLSASGTHQMIEAAPSGAVLGKRSLLVTTAGTAFTSSLHAYGSYLIEMDKSHTGSTLSVAFISDRTNATLASVGYRLDISSLEHVRLYRNTGAAAVLIMGSAAAYVVNDVMYSFWVSRTSATFALWIKGGAFTAWTLVDVTGGTGTNPVAETTYSNSKYIACRSDVSGRDLFGDVIHYRTAMTPTEAIALGILEP